MAIHKLMEIKRRKFVLTERKVRWSNVAFGSCKYELPKSKSIFCWNGKFLKQKDKKRWFKWLSELNSPGNVDQKHTSSLSFHCWGREVFAALWNQPHAAKTQAFAQVTWVSSQLASQDFALADPAQWAKSLAHLLIYPRSSLQASATQLGDIEGTWQLL